MAKDDIKLNIKFSKDIEKYKESVIKGFALREAACLVAGAVIILTVWLGFKYIFGIDNYFTMYGAIAIGAPVIFTGFYERCGLTFFQIIKKKIALLQIGTLINIPEDCTDMFINSETDDTGEKTDDKNEMQQTLFKGIFTIAGIIIIATVIMIIVFVVK